MKTILFVGEALIDLISREYIYSIKDARFFSPFFGGSPANISVMLGDLGVSPRILTRVGDDPFGRGLLDHLRERGVDTSYVQIDPFHHTSMVLIAKSKDYHDFLPLRGADYNLEDPPCEILEDVGFVHLSSWPLTGEKSRGVVKRLWERARDLGILPSFDPNYRERLSMDREDVRSLIKDMIKGIYLIKPSLEDSYVLFGEDTPYGYIERFHLLDIENVVLSLGKEGVLVSDGRTTKHLPSLARSPVDTTGGGDGLWAGIYYGLLNGWDIFRSTELGNVIAAYRVERESASDKLPPLDILEREYLQKEVKR